MSASLARNRPSPLGSPQLASTIVVDVNSGLVVVVMTATMVVLTSVG